jgi:hypothetical protein
MDAITIISTSQGTDRKTSLILMITSSRQPPQYPDARPTTVPMNIEIAIATNPTSSDAVVPWTV